MITGNIEGIRGSLLAKLEKLYELKVPKYNVLTEEISEVLCNVTNIINREISVAIDRKGNIIDISIGDSSTAELPEINIKDKKLSGIRIVHTHPNGNYNLSAVDLSALINLKLDAIAALGTYEGGLTGITIGFCSLQNDFLLPEVLGPMKLNEAVEFDFTDKLHYIEELIKNKKIIDDNTERAILVGIESEESLTELSELAKACNVKCLTSILQNREKIDTALFIGSGKVDEINLIKQRLKANLIIFDDELTGSQVRNLEDAFGVKVIDRTTLILEIFARRARSKEAKIQVELAQLKYRIPRLMGLGTVLSRTGGGIGTKGPGEKKLEIDKRHIRERVYELSKELEKVRKNREIQREKRSSSGIPKIALVGYTNAGKSTLRNKLCTLAAPIDASKKENVFEADMLFATLDITTRAITLPDNRIAAITDTVGFVRKLPHDLVEAFKSTLEEVVYSDLLLHVVDASNEEALLQIETVYDVLSKLGAGNKPSVLVLNKIDKSDNAVCEQIKNNYPHIEVIQISAKNEINLDKLLEKICEKVPNKLIKVKYIIPYTEQSAVAFLHKNAFVESEEYLEEGTSICAEVDDKINNKFAKYIVH